MTAPPPEPDSSSPDTRGSGAGFVSDVMKLVGATTFAQILAMVSSPIVTRLYGPEAFGVYAVFLSIIGTFVMVICLRYELPIVLPRSDRDAAPLLWLSIAIAGIVSLLMVPLVLLFRLEIEAALNSPGLGQWLLLVPVTLFVAGIFQALNYWNTRTRQFGRLSAAQVTRSIAIVGTQLAAGVAGYVSGGSLILGAVAGYLGSTAILSLLIWREDRAILREGLDLPAMIRGMKRYRNFPLIDSWSAFLTNISAELPVFLLATFFSTAVVGSYSLGLTVLQIPMSFIGSSFSQVFFPAAAAARHEGEAALVHVVEETVIRLIILGSLPFLVLLVIGKELFTVVFGSPWAEAGVFTQILAPWIMLTFISVPISSLFSVLERQRDSLILNVVTLPIRAGSLVIGGLLGNPLIALGLFSVVGIVYVGGTAVYLIRRTGSSLRRIFDRAWRFMLYVVPIVGVILVAKVVLSEYPILIVVVAGLAVLPYYWLVVLRDPVFRAPVVAVLHHLRIPVPKWIVP